MQDETRLHPVTGEVLSRQTRKQVVSWNGKSVSVDVPGWYPAGDGDSLHSGRDLMEKHRARRSLKDGDL